MEVMEYGNVLVDFSWCVFSSMITVFCWISWAFHNTLTILLDMDVQFSQLGFSLLLVILSSLSLHPFQVELSCSQVTRMFISLLLLFIPAYFTYCMYKPTHLYLNTLNNFIKINEDFKMCFCCVFLY